MARGNPFSFRPRKGLGDAMHRRECGLPRRFAARNDIFFVCCPIRPAATSGFS